MKTIEHIVEKIIFFSRWIQMPIYLGLIVASVLYTVRFTTELIHLVSHYGGLTETTLMVSVLTVVDISMVVNLLIVVTIGVYTNFVSRLFFGQSEDKPQWLEHIDSNTLKVKLAGSLVGVSGIHLLQSFMNIKSVPMEHVLLQVLIHFAFLLSAVMMAWTGKLLHESATFKHQEDEARKNINYSQNGQHSQQNGQQNGQHDNSESDIHHVIK
jgi:uncharacterized protein (TIGR00645 family)